jgi:hypothetical protein
MQVGGWAKAGEEPGALSGEADNTNQEVSRAPVRGAQMSSGTRTAQGLRSRLNGRRLIGGSLDMAGAEIVLPRSVFGRRAALYIVSFCGRSRTVLIY